MILALGGFGIFIFPEKENRIVTGPGSVSSAIAKFCVKANGLRQVAALWT